MGLAGGLPGRRLDQAFRPGRPVVAPGAAAGTFRGRLVVIYGTGPNNGIFVYRSAPALGNLYLSIVASSTGGTDPYGNPYYGPGMFVYGSLSGGVWSDYCEITNSGVVVTNASDGSGALVRSFLASGSPTGRPRFRLVGYGVNQPNTPSSSVDLYGSNSGGTSPAQVSVSRGTSAPEPVTAALLDVQGDLGLAEQSAAPPVPSGGGVLYADSTGHLHYLGPGGTDTILANP